MIFKYTFNSATSKPLPNDNFQTFGYELTNAWLRSITSSTNSWGLELFSVWLGC